MHPQWVNEAGITVALTVGFVSFISVSLIYFTGFFGLVSYQETTIIIPDEALLLQRLNTVKSWVAQCAQDKETGLEGLQNLHKDLDAYINTMDSTEDINYDDILEWYNLTENTIHFLLNNFNLLQLQEFKANLSAGFFNNPDNIIAFIDQFSVELWNYSIILTGGSTSLLFSIFTT